MERKGTYRQYHVQDNAEVERKDVKMYCNTNQFPELSFSGTHYKLHGASGWIKHYHLSFDTQLVIGVYEIRRIQCACVVCTSFIALLFFWLYT